MQERSIIHDRAALGGRRRRIKMRLEIMLASALMALVSAAAPHGVAAAGKTVLFDEAHGQQFLVGGQGNLDLSGLAQVFRESGAETASLRGPVTEESLAGARALVISGPFQGFSPEEIDVIARFVQGGGRLALMLHIPQPAQGLMQRLGVTFWSGVVSEEENLAGDSPQDFYVSRLEPHPLTSGLDRFAAYGAWSVTSTSRSAMVIARTGPRAWIDIDRDRVFSAGDLRDSFGIVVQGTLGEGHFAVFGDDAIFQNQFLRGKNRALAANLARWLVR